MKSVTLFRSKLCEKWGAEVVDSYFLEKGVGKGTFEDWLQRFRDVARQKIARDRAKAEDKEFRSRHVSGYEFFTMPQLGEDMGAFVTSFCRTLELKTNLGKVMNLLASVVRDEFDAGGEATDIQAWMSRIWLDSESDDVEVAERARTIKEALARYHEGWKSTKIHNAAAEDGT